MKTSKKAIYAGLIAGIAIAVGLSILFSLKTLGNTPLTGVNPGYALYYPAKMPEGYSLKEGSLQQTPERVLYQLIGAGGDIQVSQQPKPDQLDSFNLDGFSQVSTSIGTMYLGLVSENVTAIVSAYDTLLIVTAPQSFAQDSMTVLVDQLKKVD